MLRKLWLIGNDFADRMREKNISSYAAGTAFFFFLSLVPILIMICTILPYTPLTQENLLHAAQELFPEKLHEMIRDLIQEVYDKSAGILSIAIVATLWTAGKGMLALIRGLNAVCDGQEKRNYFVLRIVSCLYTILMLAVMLLSLAVMVFGGRILGVIRRLLPLLSPLISMLLRLRFLFVLGILTIVFAAIYAFVPSVPEQSGGPGKRFKEQIPGAAFTAVVWGLFSWGFSIYVDFFNYGVYGSLAMIIIVMLWMYFCMYIILVGAYVNCYFQPVNRVLVGEGRSRGQRE